MQLTASDIVSLYRPTPCSLRLYLREQGVPESEASAFEQIIQTLGHVHEQNHLATLGAYEDISAIERDQQAARTLEAIKSLTPVIYQGEFVCETTVDGVPAAVVGRPDFLIFDGDGYIVRDSKFSRRVDEDHHDEITLQLQLYGCVKGGVKPDQWGGVKVDQSAAGKLLDMRGVWRLERSGRRHTPRSGLRRGGWVAGAAVRGWRDRVYACSA
jgi:hypothetical protein